MMAKAQKAAEQARICWWVWAQRNRGQAGSENRAQFGIRKLHQLYKQVLHYYMNTYQPNEMETCVGLGCPSPKNVIVVTFGKALPISDAVTSRSTNWFNHNLLAFWAKDLCLGYEEHGRRKGAKTQTSRKNVIFCLWWLSCFYLRPLFLGGHLVDKNCCEASEVRKHNEELEVGEELGTSPPNSCSFQLVLNEAAGGGGGGICKSIPLRSFEPWQNNFWVTRWVDVTVRSTGIPSSCRWFSSGTPTSTAVREQDPVAKGEVAWGPSNMTAVENKANSIQLNSTKNDESRNRTFLMVRPKREELRQFGDLSQH